ncbi:MAG: PfkB family carbohydrate kinase [Candidatus Micrarchaeota archaeon]
MPDLKKIIGNFAGKRILVIGDVMLDAYFLGQITRISPEAPVPVVNVSEKRYSLGGAANIAFNISQLGAKAHLLGLVGNDGEGRKIAEMAKTAGISAELIPDGSRPTTMKLRILSNNRHILRVDSETAEKIPEKAEKSLLDSFAKLLPSCDGVIISDYNKGVISKSTSNAIIDAAGKHKKPVFIDSKNYLSYGMKGAALLKPNLKELSKETGIDVSDEEGIKKAAQSLHGKLLPDSLLVTLGEKGMLLLYQNKFSRIDGLKTHAVDVSGAGDTVIASFALASVAGASPSDAAKIANCAASIVVSKVGTVAPSISELKALL